MATYEQNEANNDEYEITLAQYEELTKLADEQGYEVEDLEIPEAFEVYTVLVKDDKERRFDTDAEALGWLKSQKGE